MCLGCFVHQYNKNRLEQSVLENQQWYSIYGNLLLVRISRCIDVESLFHGSVAMHINLGVLTIRVIHKPTVPSLHRRYSIYSFAGIYRNISYRSSVLLIWFIVAMIYLPRFHGNACGWNNVLVSLYLIYPPLYSNILLIISIGKSIEHIYCTSIMSIYDFKPNRCKQLLQ